MGKVKVIIAGAGARGTGYAGYALTNPDLLEVVGVAEPRDFYRNQLKEAHSISEEKVFLDWRDMAEREKFADFVIVATQDAMHTEPAIAFMKKGYHLLLEKPMAPTAEECRKITAVAQQEKVMFGVCHVLRYTRYTQRLKEIVDSGLIGDIVSLQHLEPVGYWHQAHSFVRGNWRNESESSFMLLAKSCHDLDWIRYIMGCQCEAVSSFGSLKHFCRAEKPAGAGNRCLECGIEKECPYSAKKIYIGRVERGHTAWPVDVLTPDTTVEGVMKALADGPYGRCVYECDNDVVDNQVVNLKFAGNRTAAFTMTAFNAGGGRKTRIFGTRGELEGDSDKIRYYDFMTDEWRDIELAKGDHTAAGGHGGGDYGLMQAFVKAVAENDPSKIISGPDETLESHLIVFAAEKARKNNTVVALEK